MINRQRLVDEGVVPCPPGMSSNNPENEAVKIAIKEVETPTPVKKKKKKKKSKKKRKLLCLSLYKKSFFLQKLKNLLRKK